MPKKSLKGKKRSARRSKRTVYFSNSRLARGDIKRKYTYFNTNIRGREKTSNFLNDFLEYYHQKTGKNKVAAYNRLRIIFGNILMRRMRSGNKIILTRYIALRPEKGTENLFRLLKCGIFEGSVISKKRRKFHYKFAKLKKRKNETEIRSTVRGF